MGLVMKKEKTVHRQKMVKNRLLCVTLSEALLKSSKKYRRTVGFSSMSELLRATANHRSAAILKKNAVEPKKQISFRLSDELYFDLTQAASRTGQSIARIIRTLLENAPKLGIRPEGVSATKTPASHSSKKKPSAVKKPSRPAKKQPSKVAKGKVPASKKSATKGKPATKEAKVVAKKQKHSSATKKNVRSRKK